MAMISPQNTPSTPFTIDDFYKRANEQCIQSRAPIQERRRLANVLIEQLIEVLASPQAEATLTSKNIANIIFVIGKLAANHLIIGSVKSKFEFIENLFNRMHETIARSDRPTQEIANMVYGLGLMAKSGVVIRIDYNEYCTQLKNAFHTCIRNRTGPDENEDEYTYLDSAIKAAYDEFKKEVENPAVNNLSFFGSTVTVNEFEATRSQNLT